jgi:tetratricopeptide (TPR) repeat protein
MSKDKKQLLSPLFLKYQTDYEKNPRSRVFAPLAETYRKLGMIDKAMEILSQGIRYHPTYVMGYLGLAFCYFDLKQYSLAYNTLRPLVETSRDNIRLQKLFAEICLELGYKEESLDTYKYLLFINPRDRDVAIQVATLESLIEEQYKPVHQPIYIPESEFRTEKKESSNQLFDIDKLDNRPLASKADFDDWMAVDLSRDQKEIKSEDPYEFWNLKKGDSPVDLSSDSGKKNIVKDSEEISYQVLDVKSTTQSASEHYVELNFEDDSSDEGEEENEIQPHQTQTAPAKTTVALVTHTLVDLYCGQGHIEKALEVLEKILILNPTDERTINKILEIKALMGPYREEMPKATSAVLRAAPVVVKEIAISHVRPHLEPLKDISEEDGRKNLMSILDQQLGAANEPLMKEIAKGIKEDKKASAAAKKPSPPTIASAPSLELQKNRQIEEKLTEFLKKIQKRALDYQARL